jgi:hypothetical protein
MPHVGSRSVRAKAILIQLAIVVGLIAWFKIFLPEIERARAAAETAERERRIQSLVQTVVAEELRPDDGAPAGGGEAGGHPQRLRVTPPVREVQEALGAPDQSMTDFRGGQHLTWIGTNHKLEASFNKGRLYALTLVDLRSGHGATVFESSSQWRPF